MAVYMADELLRFVMPFPRYELAGAFRSLSPPGCSDQIKYTWLYVGLYSYGDMHLLCCFFFFFPPRAASGARAPPDQLLYKFGYMHLLYTWLQSRLLEQWLHTWLYARLYGCMAIHLAIHMAIYMPTCIWLYGDHCVFRSLGAVAGPRQEI